MTRYDDLTPRQRSVLREILTGRSPKQIALANAKSTLDWHLGRIYRALGVGSRPELMAYCAQHAICCGFLSAMPPRAHCAPEHEVQSGVARVAANPLTESPLYRAATRETGHPLR